MAEGTRQAVLLSGMNTGEVFEVISAWRDTGTYLLPASTSRSPLVTLHFNPAVAIQALSHGVAAVVVVAAVL